MQGRICRKLAAPRCCIFCQPTPGGCRRLVRFSISPPGTGRALRRRAKALDKSLNEVLVEALSDGVGLRETRRERRDLTDIAGTWTRERSVEAALAAEDTVDEDLWR